MKPGLELDSVDTQTVVLVIRLGSETGTLKTKPGQSFLRLSLAISSTGL